MNKEKQLILLCKQDLKHFEKLYEWYFKDVYRYAYSLVCDKNRAEEITAQTFFNALENIKKFKWKGKSIKHWLFVICRNIVYKDSKKRGTQISIDESIGKDFTKNDLILDQLVKENDIEQIKSLINNLPTLEQEVIRLRIWEEFSFKEIAQTCHMSLSQAKMRYYRALDKIKNFSAMKSRSISSQGFAGKGGG